MVTLFLSILLTPDAHVLSNIKDLDSPKFKTREHAREMIHQSMLMNGKFSFAILKKVQLYYFLNKASMTIEGQRRLVSTIKQVWKEYINVMPSQYWKIPMMPDDLVRTRYDLFQKATTRTYDIEYPDYRHMTKMYVEEQLTNGVPREDVIRMLDDWAVREVNCYLQSHASYFFAQTKARFKK